MRVSLKAKLYPVSFKFERSKWISLRSKLAEDLIWMAAQYFEFSGCLVFKSRILNQMVER